MNGSGTFGTIGTNLTRVRSSPVHVYGGGDDEWREAYGRGPWVAAASPSSVVGWPVVGPMGRSICNVSWMPKKAYPDVSEADYAAFNAECEANARLIAAAPNLLTELKRLSLAYVGLLESGRDRIISLGGQCDPVDVMEAGDPSLKSAKAAIAKTEGRAP